MLLLVAFKIWFEIWRRLLFFVPFRLRTNFPTLQAWFVILGLLRVQICIRVEKIWKLTGTKAKCFLETKLFGLLFLEGTRFHERLVSLIFGSRFRAWALSEWRVALPFLICDFWARVHLAADSTVRREVDWFVVLIEELLLLWLSLELRLVRSPICEHWARLSVAHIVLVVLSRFKLLGKKRNPRSLVANIACVKFVTR